MAAIWGFAEATVFFIVPDVLLTLVALTDRRLALVCCGWALAGALLGGGMMYAWGASDTPAAYATLDQIPAIDPIMMQRVITDTDRWGLGAVCVGPALGIPYKIYAVAAGQLGLGIGWFLLVSIPARLIRFVLLTELAAWLSGRFSVSVTRKRCIWAYVWLLFYAGYFWMHAE